MRSVLSVIGFYIPRIGHFKYGMFGWRHCKMHEKKMRTSLWSTMTNCFNYALLNAI